MGSGFESLGGHPKNRQNKPMYEQQSLQLFGNAALITSSDMGWFLFLVDSRFLGGMIGVVDQGKGYSQEF